MRKFILPLLALLIASSAILAAEGKNFEDAQKRFHLTVPPSLIASTQPDNPKILVQLAPAGKPATEFVQVRIESTRALPNVDLDRLADEFAYELKKKNLKAAETTDAKVGALPAKKITYGPDPKKPGATGKGEIYLFIVNDWAWCIDIHSPDADFDSFRAIGEQVVSSFGLETNATSQPSNSSGKPTKTMLSSGLTRYAVSSDGYSIDVPADWIWTPVPPSNAPLTMLIRLPGSVTKGKTPTLIELILENETPDLKGVAASMSDALKKKDANAKVDAPVMTTLGGEPAVQINSVAALNHVAAKTVHVICNHAGKQYTLSFVADPDAFDQSWPAVQTAFASFHFSK